MPRTKPQYEWPLTSGEPLKAESHSHKMKPKAGGKRYKESREPVQLPSRSQGVTNVHFGSHKSIERQIGDEMRRLGL